MVELHSDNTSAINYYVLQLIHNTNSPCQENFHYQMENELFLILVDNKTQLAF